MYIANQINSDKACVQSMYLRPSRGHLTDNNAILVLDTDLTINPGKACTDMRLGDLLVALDDMMAMAGPGRAIIDAVEIRGKAH